ncbi:MAG TPA: aminopeptidase [Thermoplasmata archaeon]|nr:aminopeptidase [Thermoplasmata archaeon]
MAQPSSGSRETEFARAILTQNLKVRPGENVIIEGWSRMIPWATALARETRRLKAFPLVFYQDEDSYWDSVDAREDDVLGATPAHEWAAVAKADVYIHMWNAGDRLRQDKLGEKRNAKLFGWNPAWYKAATKAGLRGSRLDIGRPFPSLATVYGVDQAAWMDQLIEASLVDPDEMIAAAKPIAKALEKGRRVHITSDNGTDLTLGLARRRARIDAGRVSNEDKKVPFGMLNILPAGVVRVALDESVADGKVVANRASYNDIGMSTGGVLEFRKGRLVRHHFDEGAAFFDKPYAKGGKGRDRPGYLGVGLNPKLHNTPQMEDREAGALTITVGNNQFVPGGKNKANFGGIVVLAGARLEIDGKPITLPG